jgi:hypothetical protein
MRAHVRNNRDPLARQAFARRERRNRPLAEAMRKHGIPGIAALLDLLQAELGAAIEIDRRLERLVDADPSAMASLARKDGRR